MGQFFVNLREAVDDFKSGWYFRVWCLIWLVCAVVAFAALIELGKQSSERSKERDWNTWMENATQMTFPNFRFKFSHETQINETFLTNPICSHLGTAIPVGTCSDHPTDMLRCFSVMADTITIINSVNSPPGDERIVCDFGTNTSPNITDQLIGWELESSVVRLGRHNYDSMLWLAPRKEPGMWVLMRKGFYSPLLGTIIPTQDYAHPFWEKTSLSHSSVYTPGKYHVEIILSTFRVIHNEQMGAFTGWMAVGSIGGFAFWMLILHVIVMILVGFFFNNESRFLNASGRTGPEGKAML